MSYNTCSIYEYASTPLAAIVFNLKIMKLLWYEISSNVMCVSPIFFSNLITY